VTKPGTPVEHDGWMYSEQPVPRELKVVSTASLLVLEEIALDLCLNQRLPPAWVAANAAPEGNHYLWPALWNSLRHRPAIPRQLRCELLLKLRTGEQVMGLLDVLPDDFAPLPRVTSLEEGMHVGRLLDSVSSVSEWELRQVDGAKENGQQVPTTVSQPPRTLS
jgi:hypothetical protein